MKQMVVMGRIIEEIVFNDDGLAQSAVQLINAYKEEFNINLVFEEKYVKHIIENCGLKVRDVILVSGTLDFYCEEDVLSFLIFVNELTLLNSASDSLKLVN
ncbi:MAG: hypothetical protein LBT75_01230 [Bacilli bacterium]|jgi:hypothetical protein|nr:hypothetical protein [Bacilli bacterium]